MSLTVFVLSLIGVVIALFFKLKHFGGMDAESL